VAVAGPEEAGVEIVVRYKSPSIHAAEGEEDRRTKVPTLAQVVNTTEVEVEAIAAVEEVALSIEDVDVGAADP
jgi:hypothetical protein